MFFFCAEFVPDGALGCFPLANKIRSFVGILVNGDTRDHFQWTFDSGEVWQRFMGTMAMWRGIKTNDSINIFDGKTVV